MPRWNKRPTKAELVAVMDREHTVAAVALHFNCSRESVYTWFTHYGLRKRYVRQVNQHAQDSTARPEPY